MAIDIHPLATSIQSQDEGTPPPIVWCGWRWLLIDTIVYLLLMAIVILLVAIVIDRQCDWPIVNINDYPWTTRYRSIACTICCGRQWLSISTPHTIRGGRQQGHRWTQKKYTTCGDGQHHLSTDNVACLLWLTMTNHTHFFGSAAEAMCYCYYRVLSVAQGVSTFGHNLSHHSAYQLPQNIKT